MRRVLVLVLLACAVGCGSDQPNPLAEFCREAARYDTVANQPPNYSEPGKVREYLEVSLRTARRLHALSPDAIAPDVKVVLGQLERQEAALAKVAYDLRGLKPGAIEVDPAAQASGRKLAAYLRENCSFQTPEPQ
jgi:hypothetical protein